jgi:hypothetical protein
MNPAVGAATTASPCNQLLRARSRGGGGGCGMRRLARLARLGGRVAAAPPVPTGRGPRVVTKPPTAAAAASDGGARAPSGGAEGGRRVGIGGNAGGGPNMPPGRQPGSSGVDPRATAAAAAARGFAARASSGADAGPSVEHWGPAEVDTSTSVPMSATTGTTARTATNGAGSPAPFPPPPAAPPPAPPAYTGESLAGEIRRITFHNADSQWWGAGGRYKLNPVVTHSLTLNHPVSTLEPYQVVSWFQSLCFSSSTCAATQWTVVRLLVSKTHVDDLPLGGAVQVDSS